MIGYEVDGWGTSHLDPPNIAGLALRTWGGSKCAKKSIPERFGRFPQVLSICPALYLSIYIYIWDIMRYQWV